MQYSTDFHSIFFAYFTGDLEVEGEVAIKTGTTMDRKDQSLLRITEDPALEDQETLRYKLFNAKFDFW